jgi:hypothetical protein
MLRYVRHFYVSTTEAGTLLLNGFVIRFAVQICDSLLKRFDTFIVVLRDFCVVYFVKNYISLIPSFNARPSWPDMKNNIGIQLR